jgi:hypothetical protein
MSSQSENGAIQTDIERNERSIEPLPFRRGRGPQEFGKARTFNGVTKEQTKTGEVLVKLKLPRTTTARGVRRAHARLIEWVLDGHLDSMTATRLSYILENIRKSIDLQLIEDVAAYTDRLEKTARRAGVTFLPDAEKVAALSTVISEQAASDEMPP